MPGEAPRRGRGATGWIWFRGRAARGLDRGARASASTAASRWYRLMPFTPYVAVAACSSPGSRWRCATGRRPRSPASGHALPRRRGPAAGDRRRHRRPRQATRPSPSSPPTSTTDRRPRRRRRPGRALRPRPAQRPGADAEASPASCAGPGSAALLPSTADRGPHAAPRGAGLYSRLPLRNDARSATLLLPHAASGADAARRPPRPGRRVHPYPPQRERRRRTGKKRSQSLPSTGAARPGSWPADFNATLDQSAAPRPRRPRLPRRRRRRRRGPRSRPCRRSEAHAMPR